MLYIITGKKGCGKTFLTKQLIYNKTNLIVYDLNDEYNDFGQICFNLSEVKEALEKKAFPFRVCLTEIETEKSFNLLYSYKNINLVIDEFHAFSNKHKRRSILFQLIRLQRHKNLTVIGVTQRINDISPEIFSQVDYLISFKQTELRDLETLNKLGIDPETIKALPDREYYIKRF